MNTRNALNTELSDPFYQPSTPVSVAEYGAVYAAPAPNGKVRNYHAMTYAHIAVALPAAKKAAKKAAAKAAPNKKSPAKKKASKKAPKKKSK